MDIMKRIEEFETQIFLPRQGRKFCINRLEKFCDLNHLKMRLDLPRIEPGNLKEGGQKITQRMNRLRKKTRYGFLLSIQIGSSSAS